MASASGESGFVSNISSSPEIQHLRNRLPSMTVVELKGFMRDLGSQLGVRLPVSGNKSILINRIDEQLISWREASRLDAIRKAISLANHPRDARGALLDTTGGGNSLVSAASLAWQTNGYHNTGPSNRNGVPPGKLNQSNSYRQTAQAGPSSSTRPAVPRYIRFKPSPFFKVEKMLTDIILLPEADTSRKTASLDLRLTPQQNALLKSEASGYQVRLFCAQKATADISEKNPAMPTFIDFPASCELRINGSVYTSSLKGSKSKPGRVPPPNLNKYKTLITRDGVNNKIELVYTNSNIKYVMVIGLCQYTPPETIVAKLKKERSRTREEIIGSMKRAAAEDDIEIGTATLSLRDPLSYTRITEPCRSVHCTHSQCFDALFFFLSNEQSPTWNCPHCSKIIKPEDLFIDGYFAHILKTVSEDEDAVIVEADGSWKTRDGKFSSSAAAIPAASSSSLAPANGKTSSQQVETSRSAPASSSSLSTNPPTTPAVPLGAEVVELDDTPSPSNSPAPLPAESRPSSPINGIDTQSRPSAIASRPSNGSVTVGGSSTVDAIDLTESDDEDMPLARTAPVPPVSTQRQQLHSQPVSQPSPLSRSNSSTTYPGSGSMTNGSTASPSLHRPVASSPPYSLPSASPRVPQQSSSGSSPLPRPYPPEVTSGSRNSPQLPHTRPSAPAGNAPRSPGPSTALPLGYTPSRARIISSTGGLREARPLPPLFRAGSSTSYVSPGPAAPSAPPGAQVRERSVSVVEVEDQPLYPTVLPSRSASTNATPPLSSARENAFWPATFRPQQQQQQQRQSSMTHSYLSNSPSSSSSSRVRDREEDTAEAITSSGRENGAKRQRREADDDDGVVGESNRNTITSFTTRSGRPTNAVGALREDSTPLPSVTPSPPPPPVAAESEHTSTITRDSHSGEVNDDLSGPQDGDHIAPISADGAQEGDDLAYEEEEDALPIRPGRPSKATSTRTSSTGAEGRPTAEIQKPRSDSPAYTSAPEDVSASSPLEAGRNGLVHSHGPLASQNNHNGDHSINGDVNGDGDGDDTRGDSRNMTTTTTTTTNEVDADGVRSTMLTRRADSLDEDEFDGFMDDSIEWEE